MRLKYEIFISRPNRLNVTYTKEPLKELTFWGGLINRSRSDLRDICLFTNKLQAAYNHNIVKAYYKSCEGMGDIPMAEIRMISKVSTEDCSSQK